MNDILDKSIDLVLTDLPYGVTNNIDDKPINLNQFWRDIIRISKGNIILTSQFPFTKDLIDSGNSIFKYDLIWDKMIPTGFLNANRSPLRSHEHILVFNNGKIVYNPQFSKGKKSHSKGTTVKSKTNHNYGDFEVIDNTETQSNMKYPTSIISIKRPHIKRLHPTEKPVELFEYLIKMFSNKDDLVLDCCAGSGTTAIACMNTDRKYICMEKEQKYFDIMMNRISKTVKPLELFNQA